MCYHLSDRHRPCAGLLTDKFWTNSSLLGVCKEAARWWNIDLLNGVILFEGSLVVLLAGKQLIHCIRTITYRMGGYK